MKKLLQSLCWWSLMLMLSFAANAQVQYKIQYNTSSQRYEVFMKPLANYSGAQAYTGSAQVTLVVPTGNFTPTGLQSQFGAWNLDNAVARHPIENPNFDYISFYMPATVTGTNYVNGVEMPLFTFTNSGSCIGGINLINNATDPFFPSPITGTNSKNINVGNQISIFGYQNNLLANAWQSNYGAAAPCSTSPSCAIQYQIVKTGATYQVNMIPNVTYTTVGNITATQQVTLKVPTGLVYTNLVSLTSGANYTQGSRINAPSQASGSDYILFNLGNLGTSALTYTNGTSIPLFKFDVAGNCSGDIAFMPNNDPFTANTSYNSKQQITVFGYGQPDAPICFSGSGSVPCTNAPPASCGLEYEIERLSNGKFQVSMIPKVTYTAPNNTTSTQQITLKVPTGFQYTGLTSINAGANYVQGSRINAPSQAPGFDYILFNLSNLGTTALTYTNGVKVPLFTFDKSGVCNNEVIAFMPNNDPFTTNTSFNSKQQCTVLGYGQPDIPICLKGTGSVTCTPPAASCGTEYEIERLPNGKFQVSMTPKVTYTAPNNTTSTQQVTLKVPTGFQYTGLTSINAGANYVQGSRINAPSQAPGFDYILFNLSNLGTTALTYTNGVKVPLFTFDKSGVCNNEVIALMPDTDPFTTNTSFNSKQQLTVLGYGQPDIPICIKGTGSVTCTPPAANACQIKYELETVNGCGYQVSMTPNITWTTSGNITKAAKVTLRVPHGCFTVADLTSINFGASFIVANTALAPSDNPAYDYICFTMTTVPTVGIPYIQGQKVPLFTFKNGGTCCGNIELMPATDPFANGNSLNQNFDQHWETSGTGSAGVEPCIIGNPQPCIAPTGSNLLGADKVICQGQSTQLNVTGTYVSYNWSGAGLSATNVSNPTATPTATTTYYVTATTASGCAIKDDILVTVTAAPIFTSVIPSASTSCVASNGSITIAASGTGTLEYSIDNGTSWQLSNVFSGLSAGSYTAKIRRQGTTCEVANPSNPVVITTSGAPTIVSVTGSNLSSCTINNGQISIVASGSGGPFRYSIDNGATYQTSPFFTDLSVGTYSIKVTDASGTCAATASTINLTAPSTPTIVSVTPSNTTDCNLNNGSILVNSTNGTSAMEYSLDGFNWQTSNVFNGLAAASYLIRVRTANTSCAVTAAAPIAVNMPAMPTVQTVTTVTPSTCALANGSINIAANGGNGSFEYSINNGATWQSSPNFANLASGTYFVTVRTLGTACSKPFAGNPVVLNTTQAPAITSLSKINTSNCGVNDGQIVITAAGNGTLEYSVNNGTTFQASNTFSALPSGTYNIVVRTTNNTACTSVAPNCVIPTLTQPSVNNFSATPTSDCAQNNGTITINASGGVAPLQYSIDGTTWQSSNVFVGVAAGSYTLRVRNANGSCANTGNTQAVISAPASPSVTSATATGATCGQTNGSITITANSSSGVSGLQYSINNIAWQTSNIFTNLAAGTYTAYVRNANATCVTTANSTVTVPQTAGANITNVSITNSNTCATTNGTITITANGGIAPLSYSINGGINFQASNTFNNVAAGMYEIVVRNAAGTCPAVLSPIAVTAPTAPSIVTTISTNPLGCNQGNGSIQILANALPLGIGAALEYSLDGSIWQTSNIFNNLIGGSYTARVRNSANTTCTTNATAPVVLTSNSTVPTISNISKTNPSSCGASNGTITVTASGTGGLEYSIDNIHWQNANLFSNLAAGTYNVFVRNANGTCPTAYGLNPVVLNVSGGLSITNVNGTSPSNCGTNDGSIAISASGSGAPYRYSINGGATFQNSSVFTGLAAGVYNIVVTMSNGDCPTTAPVLTLTAPVAPILTNTTSTNPTTCVNNNGTITINATSGTAPYEYSLDGNVWQNSNVFVGLAAGSYTPRVRNANASCVVSAANATILIAPASPTILSFSKTDPTSCSAANGSITITTSASNIEFSINNTTWQASNIFSSLSGGSYTAYIRNNNTTCKTTYNTPIVLNAGGAHSIANVSVTNPSDCAKNDGQISITVNGAGGPFRYSINNGTTFQSSPMFSGLAAGSYNIIVTDASGACSASAPSVVITAPSAPSILSVTPTPTSDCSLSDGEINVTATFVAPSTAGQYSIDGINWQTSNNFTNVASGAYLVRVRNANGSCTVVGNTPIIVTTPAQATITNVSSTAPATCGQNTGTITVSATGGAGQLEYSIDQTNWGTNTVFTGLASGTYYVFVRNQDNSCSKAYGGNPVVINATGAPQITNVTKTLPTNCNVNDGKIIITTATSSSVLEYSINNGTSYQASNTFNGLASGTYNIMVRIVGGNAACTSSVPNCVIPTLIQPNISNVIASNPSDCALNNGTITIVANGGVAPLQYSINGSQWQSNNVFSSVAAGSYTVKVRNANGSCEYTNTAATVLTQPTGPSNVTATTTPATCGQTNGSVTVNATVSSGAEYSINGIQWQTANLFSNVAAGTYTVFARNANGTCQTQGVSTATVSQTGGSNISNVTVTNSATCGSNSGQIVINANGGTAPLQYSINGGQVYQTSNTFNNLAAGTYNIVVNNSNGTCSAVLSPITLTAPSTPNLVTVLTSNPTACNLNDGTLTILATGNGSLEYSTNGTTWQTSNIFVGLAAGSYIARVRAAGSTTCITSASTPSVLIAPTAPSITNINSTNPSSCGTTNGSITVTTSPNTGVQYSLNGIVWQNSGIFSGLGAGSYTVQIRNANGTCLVTNPSQVVLNATGGPQIATTLVVNSDDCSILNNGKITVLANGGVGQLQYKISSANAYQISNIFTNLAAGNYSITVTDASGLCQATTTATVTGPTAPQTPVASATSVTNCAMQNGTITVSTPTGVNYEYSINNGLSWQTATTFSNVAAGNYIVTVRTRNTNCRSESTVINVGSPAVPTFGTVDVNFGISGCSIINGEIVVNTSNTGNWEYSINNGSTWQASKTFSNLTQGSYNVMVRSVGTPIACAVAYAGNPIALTAPKAPTVLAILTEQATVCNGTDGKITITATSNSTLEYSINNGTSYQASNVFANLSAGTYTILVRDAASCTSSGGQVVISGSTTPTAIAVATAQMSDCNKNDATITVTSVTGGTAPYEYSLNGTTWQTSSTFTSVAAGNYTVRVRNVGSTCVFTNSTATAINTLIAPTINNITPTSATCGQNNGQIVVSGSAGALFSIDGLNYQNTGTFANLASGTYTVFIQNANNTCTTSAAAPVVLSSVSAPTISSVTATNPTDCNLTNGTITINATFPSGAAGASYSIDGGLTFQNSNVFNNIAAGTYSIVVRGSGASATCPVTYSPVKITAPNAPRIVVIATTNPTACVSDGKISVIANDGTAQLQYSLDGTTWQTSKDFTGLAAGSYTVRVRNLNTSCVKIANNATVLTAPNGISISSVAKTDPTTCVASNGTITITASTAGVQYSIDNIHWQTANVFNNLAAGAYTAYIRNADGTCETPYSANPIVLNGTGAPVITAVQKTDVTDCNLVNGSITIQIAGSVSQFKYSIDNGATYQLSQYFSGLTAGTYSIKVTDLAGNCPAVIPNVVVSSPIAANITAVNAVPTSNCGTNNGSISITASFSSGNGLYSIDNGANWTSSNVFNNLAAGLYIIKVKNTDGKCEQIYPTAVEVKEPTKPTFVSVTQVDPLACGLNTGSITISATGGTGTFEYSINGTTWQASGSFTNLIAGAYTVAVRNAGSNCPVQYAGLVNIAAPPAPSIISVLAKNPTTCSGNNGEIKVTATSATAGSGLEYSINGSNYQSSNTFVGLSTGTYNILVRNVGGTCPITYPSVTITAPVAPVINATIPTAVSDCNGNDGKIIVGASSSSALGLEYSVDGINWSASNFLMNLVAGTYTVRVRDLGTTCVATAAPVTVAQPNNLTVINNVAKTNPTGCGKNDGSITISATPNSGVMYTIDGINWTTNNTFNNLAAGSYTIKVRNANGTCPVSYSALTILTPGPIAPQITNVTITNVSDCAANDGKLEITATFGATTGTLSQYSIDGGVTFQSSNTFTGLAAGYYDIVVRNNDGSCSTLFIPAEIKKPATPALVTAILTKPSDCSIPNAKITVLASGGISPLQYSIDNGATWTTNNVFGGLAPGYYYVKIRNANGTCTQTYGPNPVKSCEFDLALRKTLTNKADSVTRLGRDIDFTIKVFNQGAVAAKDIEVVDYLPKGTMLSPKDQNGWSMLPQVAGTTVNPNTIFDPSLPLKARKIITQMLQPGDSAIVQIKLRIMFGGVFAKLTNIAEIAGARDEAGVFRQDGDSTPDEINGNDKTVDDTIDDKGTTDEDDEDPAPFKLDDYDPHGYIYCDKAGTLMKGGKIQLVTAPVGGAIYFATDNNGIPIDGRDGVYQFFTNGVPGNYNITYVNPNGYTLSTMVLPQAGSFNPAGTDNTAIDKDGVANNIVVLGSLAQADTLSNKASTANPYYLSFTFNANETTIISHNNIPVSCACVTATVCDDTNGDGAPTPGEPGINGVTVELYNCTTNTLLQTAVTSNGGKYKFSGLLSGNYKLKFILANGYSYATNASGQTVGIDNQGNTPCFVLDYAGCQERTACLKACPTVTISPNVTICAGSSTVLAATGGNGTFSWSPAAGLNATSGASVTATPNATTVYTVTSTGAGCTSTASVTVTVVTPPASNFTVNVNQPSSCTTTNGSITINATGTGLEYSINDGNTWQVSNIFSGLASGSYVVKIRNVGTQCAVSYASNPVDLTPASAPNITNATAINPTNCTTPNGSINITANSGSGALQYSINNGLSYQTSNLFTNLAAGTYQIKVKNGNGSCESSYPNVVLSNNIPVINAVNVVSDCANNNRSITILASGGVSPLEYSINGGTTWTTNNVFTGLAPGTYNVAVRNFNGTCVVNYTQNPITMCNYDLALTKKLAAGQSGLVRLGDIINYEITVTNQGGNPVKDVQVVDYLPQGMQLSPAGNNGWVQTSADMAVNTISSTIAAGQSIVLNMAVQLVYGSPNTSLKNSAEIKSMKDVNGNPVTDIDSTPDMIKGNDNEKDNVTNENGKNNSGDDEDDSDFENILLDNFDPSGYIYCEKTGKIITGGKLKLVSAPAGGDVFFSTDANGILLDGSTGMYQVFTNGVSGNYTFTYVHPNGYPLSTTCLPEAGSFNPKGKDGDAAYDKDGAVNGTIHLGSVANNGYLANKSCAANKYFLSFTLEKDEKVLIATNNLPVSCAIISGTIKDCKTQAGVSGMDVKIYDCNSTTGVAFAFGKTDANGNYIFDGLKTGKYKVQIVGTSGQIIQGGKFDQSGTSACIDIKYGEMVMDLNACFSTCPTINNLLTVQPWCPKNNGVIIIDAVCQGDLEYSIDGGKTYQHLNAFMNLAPGSYTIKVKSSGCEQDYKNVIVLACENDNTGGKGSISGKAFKSCSDSGIKGANKGLANVKVTLTSSTGTTQNATTNATGLYNFTNVEAGAYSITFEKATGFDFAKQNQGNDDANDSDVDASGKTTINVAANQLLDNVDAGYKDVQAPVLTFIHPLLVGKKDGETVYMECGFEEVLKEMHATAKDNCDPNPTIKMEDGLAVVSKECSKDGFLVKMYCGWIATDECGNKSQTWLYIVVRDTQAPTLSGVPASITIGEKDLVPAAATVVATDKCDTGIKAIFAETKNGNAITRTWTATDQCGNKTTATQVITIKKDNAGPCTISITPVPVTYAASCAGKDGKAKITPSNYTYKWADGVIGDTRLDLDKGTYSVTATDANGCTAIFNVIIKDGCTFTGLTFAKKGEIRQVACGNPQNEYCLDFDFATFVTEYKLLENGQPYANKIQPCVMQSHGEYSLAGLINVPLSVQNWTVAGQKVTFSFANLDDLAAKMNQYDSNGGWKINALDEKIYNENFDKKRYGDLTIGNTNLGVKWIMQASSFSIPKGIKLMVSGMGKHEIVLAHKTKPYQDTMRIQFACTTPQTFNVILDEGDIEGVDIATTELVGIKCTMEQHEIDGLSNSAEFRGTLRGAASMVMVTGMHVGEKRTMYTMCDEYGICDTAEIRVLVREKIKVEEAIDKYIKVYNGFSPNGDGQNDVFTIKAIEFYPENTLTIYNRWGNEVYHIEGYKNSWRGTYDGKDLPDGTYFYRLEIKGQEPRNGFVEIKR